MSAVIRTATFNETEHYCFVVEGSVFVALRPLVEGMGLDWPIQLQNAKKDPVLRDKIKNMAMPHERGELRECICLRLDFVQGWLFSINTSKIRLEKTLQQINLYKRDCYKTLYECFSIERDRIQHQKNESESLRIRTVSEARQTWGNKVAQEVWNEVGLIKVPGMTDDVSIIPSQLAFNLVPADQDQGMP